MNVLDAIPVIGNLIDKVILNPNEANNLKLELEKLEVQRDIAKHDVQKAWLGNKSPYVAGAIPTILWMVSGVIAFNHILAPLLMAIGLNVPVLELPAYYTDLAGTIVLGLFAKKAWDSSEIKVGGYYSPIKGEKVEAKDPDYYKKRYEELAAQYGKECSK
ncbi:3TM-type holin [Aminobacterium colombiense]